MNTQKNTQINTQTNAHCKICGNGYRVCNSCRKSQGPSPWRAVADSMEHYKIYLTVHHYTISGDKTAAAAELQNCDLSGQESFLPEIQSAIKEILAGS